MSSVSRSSMSTKTITSVAMLTGVASDGTVTGMGGVRN